MKKIFTLLFTAVFVIGTAQLCSAKSIVVGGPVIPVNLGPDTAYCGSVVLDAGAGPYTYMWNTGDTTQTITVTVSGTYAVMVMDSASGIGQDTVNIVINPIPLVNIVGSSMICSGSSALLIASGADSYAWVNGPATDSNMVTPAGDSTFWVVGLDSAGGCTDSASFTVWVGQPDSMTQNVSICQGDSVVVGTNVYNTAGTYVDSLISSYGCDSVVTTVLVVNTASAVTQTINGCVGDSVVVGTSVYYAAGTYVDTLSSMSGCDSIVTTTFTITTVNTAVTVSSWGGVLTASAPAPATWQWINCASGNAILSATQQSFYPSANGSFACVVTQNGCSDTSSCTAVTNVGITENVSVEGLMVSPNPAVDMVTVVSPEPTQIVVYNMIGEVVFAQQIRNTLTIDLTSFQSGIYFIRTTEGATVRIVKE